MRRSGPSWSLLRPLLASLPFHYTSFPLSPSRRLTISFRLLRQSLPVVVRSSLSVSLAPTGGVSIMTPRGGTIPEVKSERRNHDVHSMESLSSTGAGCSKVATHARLYSSERGGKFASFDRRARHSREHESRASSCRGKVASCRYLVLSRRIIESATFLEENLIGYSEVKAAHLGMLIFS